MNLKTTKMSEYKFYFDEDTVNYYVKESEKFGNFHTAFEIYKYIADECDYDGETDMRALYLDLLKQVEDKINE
jgi:hypothetical protein